MKILSQSLKNFFQLLLFGALLLLPVTAVNADKSKVVLHLSNQYKLHVLVNTVINIRNVYGDEVDIIAVINGPAVTKFARFSNTEDQVQQMLDRHAELLVCSIAMENKKMLKQQLLANVTYLEKGGVAKLIELQQQGYAYIKI